jgi:uncharacterized protein (DUF433 family)
MGVFVQYPHLSIDADGTARIEGSRFKVIHLAGEHYYYGWSAEEILRQHPDLRPEQVYAALTYFYDHHESLVRQMHDTAVAAEEAASRQSISRDELLKRRAAPDA